MDRLAQGKRILWKGFPTLHHIQIKGLFQDEWRKFLNTFKHHQIKTLLLW